MDEQRLRQLWDYMNNQGQDVGSFEQFKEIVSDTSQLRKIYSYMGEQGQDVGTWEQFNEILNVEPPKSDNNFLDLGRLNDTWVGNLIDDVARGISRGYRDGNTIDETLTLMMRGSQATPQNIDQYIEAAQWSQEHGQSDNMKEFIDAGGFNTLEGWKTFWLDGNGSTIIPETIAESLTGLFGNPVTGSIIAGGGAISAATAGTGTVVAMPVATGLASGTLESASTFSQLLQEEIQERGLELDREGVKAVLEDELAMKRLREKSLARGMTIGTLDAITGRIASTIGGKVAGQGLRTSQKVGRISKKFGVEMVGGAGGEFAAQLIAGEPLDLTAIGLETFSELGSGATNVFGPIISDTFFGNKGEDRPNNNPNRKRKGLVDADPYKGERVYKVNGETVERGDMERVLNENAEEISKGNISINIANDNELSTRYQSIINATRPEGAKSKKQKAREKAEREGLEQSDVQDDTGTDVETKQGLGKETVEGDQQTTAEPSDVAGDEGTPRTVNDGRFRFVEDDSLRDGNISIEVEDLATGEKATVELNALAAQNKVKADYDKIKKIRECF